MSDRNAIYEITSMIRDRQNIENDLTQAAQTVKSMFQEKYINKLQSEIERRQKNSRLNPSDEVKLMYALKPFINEKKRPALDNIVNLLINFNTIESIQKDLVSNREISIQSALKSNNIPEKDIAIQEDGIYEIDERCITSKQNGFFNKKSEMPFSIIFILLLALMMK